MLQVHHAHLLLSLLPLHVLPPPPLLRPPRCCRRERTARAPSLVRSGCADAYMIRRSGGERGRRRVRRRARGLTDCQAAATPTGKANRGGPRGADMLASWRGDWAGHGARDYGRRPAGRD
ncbi:unnamed protein product [Prorocentrum cordatum]|uniref:Uncharacterized protein n=1 Tax=Prorocentrum cordatum TaxID=2364126 RepID=A0ABN9SCR2_9DINO|nr:unnamed protein product [Polarella glacialis]